MKLDCWRVDKLRVGFPTSSTLTIAAAAPGAQVSSHPARYLMIAAEASWVLTWAQLVPQVESLSLSPRAQLPPALVACRPASSLSL